MKILILMILMCASFNAFAGKTVDVNVVDYRSYVVNGAFYVKVSSSAISDGGSCNTTYTVPQGSTGSEQAILMIMTAHANNSKVEMGFSSCSAGSGYGTPITYVKVK